MLIKIAININSALLFLTYFPVLRYFWRPHLPFRERLSYKTDVLLSQHAQEYAAIQLKIMCIIILLILTIYLLPFAWSGLPVTNFCLTFRQHKLRTTLYVFFQSCFIIELLPYVSVEYNNIFRGYCLHYTFVTCLDFNMLSSGQYEYLPETFTGIIRSVSCQIRK